MNCQDTFWRYHCCRNRACPKCHASQTLEWLQERQAELLPCDSFHAVFASPKGRGHDTALRTGSDFSVIFAGRGRSHDPAVPNDRYGHARAPPSRGESPRPIGFSHRLRDENSPIGLAPRATLRAPLVASPHRPRSRSGKRHRDESDGFNNQTHGRAHSSPTRQRANGSELPRRRVGLVCPVSAAVYRWDRSEPIDPRASFDPPVRLSIRSAWPLLTESRD